MEENTRDRSGPGEQTEAKKTGGTGREASRSPRRKKAVTGRDFPVIGIGASAGGLEAFGKFFSAMPADTGMSFVLIQHLDPSHVSNMVSLLSRSTAMPVTQAGDGMKLEPDHVYMIPPNHIMTITDRTLRLGEQVDRPGISHNIDRFFSSLAEDMKEKAIVVILSGTGSDGSQGARAVKAELGMVMVQDPNDAAYDGMPRSAINAGVADIVLPAEQMPAELEKYVRDIYGKRRVRREHIRTDATAIADILALVRAKTKRDFSNYKQSTIYRRIERRMGINQISDTGQYLKYLRENKAEVEALTSDFLINVTSFFRDPEAFNALKKHITELLANKNDTDEIRAWVPGCSTGEEAFSIAIIITEALEQLNKYVTVQVFGSDLDDDAIKRARRGIYPASITDDVSRERLARFFEPIDDQFRVKRELREKLVFAVHDIIADPPFTRMDIISTRNLLIYFENALQKKLLPMLNYSLNPGGILFLGTAETIGEFVDEFETLDRRWKIYREKNKAKEPVFTVSNRPFSMREQQQEEAAGPSGLGKPPTDLPAANILLQALPPSILINGDQQVIYSHGETGRYLQLPEGRPNMGVMGMIRAELHGPLASAIHEAGIKNSRVQRQGVRLKFNSHTVQVRITVAPVTPAGTGTDTGFMVITFEDMPRSPRQRSKKDERAAELEQELQYTRETLRSTIEELETANEELRSTNEEYQSTNEELQSSNEELETSREELQSVNEELATVNSELQQKIEDLSNLNDDMKNLLDSTGVATIFLDEELRLQRFTSTTKEIFNFIDSDIGRPISDITHRMTSNNLQQQAKKVLDTLEPIREDIRTREGKWYTMRIQPYRTQDNAVAGVGVSFIDIDVEERLRSTILDTFRQPVLVLNQDLTVRSANQAFFKTFRVSKEETEKQSLFQLGNSQWDIPALRELIENVLPQDSEFHDYLVEHEFPAIGRRKMLLNGRRLLLDGERTQYILLIMDDVTEKK